MVARVNVNFDDMVKRTGLKLETVKNEVTQELAQTVVERTGPPRVGVITGNLRGSWFQSIGSDTTAQSSLPNDKSGAQTIGRINLGIVEAQIGDTINILNGAKYAKYLEFGTSRIKPRAMVRSTVADAPQIAEAAIRRIAKT